MAKQIKVDKDKCIGCGTCVALYPAVFRIGDDGKSEVTDPQGIPEGEVDQVINSCPAGAISFEE